MNKIWLSVLALLAIGLIGTPAIAQITVDGLMEDWPPYFQLAEQPKIEEGAADLKSWGAFIDEGYLYGYFEMAVEIEHYLTGTNDIWAGLWIDVDQAGGPGNTASSLAHTAGQLGTEWANGEFESFDIVVEWGGNVSHWGEGFNYWGAGDNATQQGSPVYGGQTAYDGFVLEFSVPISDIATELAGYPDNVTVGPAWRIGARVEASENEAGPWGGDNSDALSVTSILFADINRDGLIGSADLDVIRSKWGQQVTSGDISSGDLSGDGIVASGRSGYRSRVLGIGLRG